MPDYKTLDPKGWGGDPSRGAALGRATVAELDREATVTLHLRKVRMNGDYDSNGTYFGFVRGTSIYWCADTCGDVDFVVRATDRDDAKDKVLERYPNARFYDGTPTTGSRYSVRYVHKVAPSDKDTGPDAFIPDNAMADRKTLGKALRAAGVMLAGASVVTFRVEGDRVLVFPRCPGLTTYWHCIVLTHLGDV